MKKVLFILMLSLLVLTAVTVPQAAHAEPQNCFGLLTAAYAQAGLQGAHASSFAGEPRLGLRNLARLLYESGEIGEDSMQALGEWIYDNLSNVELGTIEACAGE